MAPCYAKILGSRSHGSGIPTTATAQARQRGTRCSWSASVLPTQSRDSHSLYKSVPAEERQSRSVQWLRGRHRIVRLARDEMAAETSLIVVFFSSPTGERCVVETTRESLKNAPAAPGGGGRGRSGCRPKRVCCTDVGGVPSPHVRRRGPGVPQTSPVRIARRPTAPPPRKEQKGIAIMMDICRGDISRRYVRR